MKIEYCRDDADELVVAFTRGHVDKAAFMAIVIAEDKMAPYPTGTVTHSWWRWIPMDMDGIGKITNAFPAKPHTRGAVPVTEVMALSLIHI